MNLDIIEPKKETEYFLLSITEICETPKKQTQTKPQETLEFELTQPRETFSFKPTLLIEGCCMVGLTNLELYKVFSI